MVESFQKTLREILDENSKKPWHTKKEIAFWRGSSTGSLLTAKETVESVLRIPRYRLVDLSKKNAALLDAQFTQYVQNENCLNMQAIYNHFGRVDNVHRLIPSMQNIW